MAPALALVMVLTAIGEQRTAKPVYPWQGLEGKVVQHSAEKTDGIGRATWNIDDRHVLQQVSNPDRSGGIGRSRLHPAIRGTGANGDHCRALGATWARISIA